MDPIAFEKLVADLFRAMGMQAVTTQRSNDGGVDVEAVDPAPIRGGKIVVQVKRYRNTVPPTAVRDLYGTVQDAGANKGVLVTTSGFGPGSHTFANGKPLELVSGAELVDLLHRHGLRGRLGDGAAGRTPADARRCPGLACPTTTTSWACPGREGRPGRLRARLRRQPGAERRPLRLLQQPAAPRTARVRALPATAPDKAAICVVLRRPAGRGRPARPRGRRRPRGRSRTPTSPASPTPGSGCWTRGAELGRAGGLRRPPRRNRPGPRLLPASRERRLGLRDRRQGLPGRAGGTGAGVRHRRGVEPSWVRSCCAG